MTAWLTEPSPIPVLALATTIHLAVLLLQFYRGHGQSRPIAMLVPAAVLSTSPWWLPSPIGLAAGVISHLVWSSASARIVSPIEPTQKPASATPAHATEPRKVETGTNQQAPAMAKGFTQVPVIGVFPETHDITTFRMARPDGFDFTAGQFTSVRIKIDGEPVVRCYSISSAPEAAGYFEISVKRQGLMSGTLHASVRPGSMVSVMPSAGGFSYPTGDDRPLALLAGGVGITPLISMLRHAVHSNPTRPVTLIYSVTTHRDVAFRDELGLLAKRHPQAKIEITTTRGPHTTDCLSGRIDGRMISDHVDEISNTIFMICGPGPMIDGMKTTLAELGVPESQIRSEAFEAAVASTIGTRAPAEDAIDAAVGGFELRLVDTNATIEISGGDTLLDACEAAGIEIPSACRAGVCGTCKCRLVNGSVRCDSDLLDDDEISDGYILPCVSWPESDCEMEA